MDISGLISLLNLLFSIQELIHIPELILILESIMTLLSGQIAIPWSIPILEPILIAESIPESTPESAPQPTLKSAPKLTRESAPESAPELTPESESGRSNSELPPLVHTRDSKVFVYCIFVPYHTVIQSVIVDSSEVLKKSNLTHFPFATCCQCLTFESQCKMCSK